LLALFKTNSIVAIEWGGIVTMQRPTPLPSTSILRGATRSGLLESLPALAESPASSQHDDAIPAAWIWASVGRR
jgi:hypothetical protein